MPIRPASSTCSALMKPCPSWPSTCEGGTRQFSKITSLVSLARMPSLSSFLPARNPAVPRSTMKAVMPRLPLDLFVTAMTTMRSPLRPCVMNCLVPLITQQSPSRTAVERMAPASLPAEASVSPHAASCSPRASGVRYRRFCSSVPNIAMCAAPSPLCAATVSETDGSTRASSSMQMQ
jgi:hypothetical protein